MEHKILIEIFNEEQEFNFDLASQTFDVEIGLAQVIDEHPTIYWQDIIGRPAYDNDIGCLLVN